MKILVGSLLGIAIGESEPACLPNSSYNECGTACPSVCGIPDADFCIEVCVPGCFCDRGFILDEKDGVCISEDDCNTNGTVTIPPLPEECPGDQVFQTSCCSTQGCSEDFPVLCHSILPGGTCPRMCVCPDDKLWDDKNQICVEESECPKECPPGLEMKKACCSQQTCDNDPVLCLDLPPGGECPEMCTCPDQSQTYDKESQTCVSRDECPKTCGENEDWNDCGTACPPVCGEPAPAFCIEMCISGCECEKGFIRDGKGGNCIPEDSCPAESEQSCPNNEHFVDCVEECGPQCSFPRPVCDQRPPGVPCDGGCTCDDGFLRDEAGNCQSEDKCPSEICPENEVWSPCDRTCEDTCENPDFSKVCRPIACGKAMCTCAYGYARNEGGLCISKKKCAALAEEQEMLDFEGEEFPGLEESKKCDPSTLPFASRYNFKKKPVKPGKNIKLTCKDAKKNPKKTKFVKCKVAKDESGNKLGAYFALNGDVHEFYDDCPAGCSLDQKESLIFLAPVWKQIATSSAQRASASSLASQETETELGQRTLSNAFAKRRKEKEFAHGNSKRTMISSKRNLEMIHQRNAFDFLNSVVRYSQK
ncbi:Oidioi.mRNA.OKI2018_I69.PAR.g13019.t1.cds [Oikopleura dioica]|uniref:Oidioi.mRNA.OKI2018_I69.PAR.g13019.t1.cds n=1 Tax=Oikopleura dioica TaxID=34765 RepID=A0ABN7SAL9_OIKDI|nr:Oidioi.mRNA.OKI2018_I69.PAR.g13019.t1.cds [Oikopleura dioica]